MPLTARCHSLRPERNSGWLAFFELVSRGGRAAHFLVVGPADNLDREAREVALRGAQAAVRYLKEVPGHAPGATLIESVIRLLTHEADESGADIEFGCAVLEGDRISCATRGQTSLIPLGEEPGQPLAGRDVVSIPVAQGDRFFFGRLPRGATPEAVSRDFLARLEHGGGGDGGLVLTVTRAGEGARLDLAPTAPHLEKPPAEARPTPAGERPLPKDEAAVPPGESLPEAEPPVEPAPQTDIQDTGSKRHEWKTVELPPRPEAPYLQEPPTPPDGGRPLPMWDDVELPEPPPPVGPPEPLSPPSSVASPEPSRAVESPAPFSDLVDELRDVFDREPEAGAEETAPQVPAPDRTASPDRGALDEEAPPPQNAALEARRPPHEGEALAEEPAPPDREAPGFSDEPPPGAEPAPVEPTEGAEPGAPSGDGEPHLAPDPELDATPEDPGDRALYAPEETRGLGFWLGVVAAVIALGALLVYLTVIRPRLASPPEEATPENVTTGEPGAVEAPGPASPGILWAQSFEEAVTSSPLVVGELVVFGCRDGRVYALDRDTGRREWAYAAPDGFGSSPTLAGELIVIGGYDGHLYGLDAATGEERWSYAIGGRVVASPAVDDESAYVGSYNRTFCAVSLVDGSLRWRKELGAVLWASPVVADDLVVTAGLDGTVSALERATGRVRWQASAGGAVYSSPVVAERKVILGSQDGSLYAFDLASGETAWKLEAGSAVDGSPGYHEGRVVVGTNDGTILGVDVGLGRIVWRVATGGEVKSRPAFRDRVVWLTGYDAHLHGIEWLTGAEAARIPIDSSAYSSPAIAQGTAYLGTMDGRLLAVGLGSP